MHSIKAVAGVSRGLQLTRQNSRADPTTATCRTRRAPQALGFCCCSPARKRISPRLTLHETGIGALGKQLVAFRNGMTFHRPPLTTHAHGRRHPSTWSPGADFHRTPHAAGAVTYRRRLLLGLFRFIGTQSRRNEEFLKFGSPIYWPGMNHHLGVGRTIKIVGGDAGNIALIMVKPASIA